MEENDFISKFGFIANIQYKSQIIDILNEEIDTYNKAQGNREANLLRLCCINLFSYKNLSDVKLIWTAKMLSQDSSGIIDIQFLCGAGLTETKNFLETQSDDWAIKALTYITFKIML